MVSIMIVEDAPFIAESLQEIVEDQGWTVSGIAKNGKEAVDLFTKDSPDLVFMDILMPEMDGISAIRNIISIKKDAKIIVISALAKRDLDKDCLEAGAKAFVKKPFKIDELILTVKKVLEGK
jgi:two-component system chemotaxis response regulator CheY